MYLAEWIAWLPWLIECLIRLVAAGLLGGIIGIEREHRGRSAGLRTQMLVGVGAALAMVITLHLLRTYGGEGAVTGVRMDPTRVAYGVMTGIGFIGAGTIITHGAGIRGLTTAASLWCTAAVGLGCGLGLFELAAAATAIVLIVLWALSWIDRLVEEQWYKKVEITASLGSDLNPEQILDLLKRRRINVRDWGVRRDFEAGRQTVTLHVSAVRRAPEDLLAVLDELKGVQQIRME